jgi:hypothetical protein
MANIGKCPICSAPTRNGIYCPDHLVEGEWLPPVEKLSKDMKEAAANLGPAEIRFLVDTYYAYQKGRIRAGNQIKAIDRGPSPEPHDVLNYLTKQSDTMEGQVKLALRVYASSKDLGQWLMSIYGIGPVIASGLLAHIDWSKPTVGHIWRFAGLDPSSGWLGREKAEELVKAEATELIAQSERDFAPLVERCCAKVSRKSANYYDSVRAQGEKPNRANLIAWLAKRPWNASLKTLCWKAGQSFIKLQSKPKDIYGKQFLVRKAIEIAKNDEGRYAEQAQVKMKLVNKNTDSWPWYAGCYPAGTTNAYAALASVFTEPDKLLTERGRLLDDRRVDPGEGVQMLPPLHINARASRWMVKLFLSHAHFVGHWLTTGQLAPNPYPIEFCGHAHVIPPPNMGEIIGLQEAWDERQRRPRGGN